MQSPFRRATTEPNAEALNEELIAARQDFLARRDSVITRAVERRSTVESTIADLTREADSLAAVERDAKSL